MPTGGHPRRLTGGGVLGNHTCEGGRALGPMQSHWALEPGDPFRVDPVEARSPASASYQTQTLGEGCDLGLGAPSKVKAQRGSWAQGPGSDTAQPLGEQEPQS